MAHLRYWLGFNMVPGIGPARLRALLDHFGGDLQSAWEAPASELREAGLDRRSIQSFLSVRGTLDLDRELRLVDEAGISILTWDNPAYPRLLRKIDSSPPVLYMRGRLDEADEWALAVVGTRQASSYGRESTRRLVTPLVQLGVTVVSGLALGIDGEAHLAALEAGGRTLAVLASGVDVIYPPEHRRLAERIQQNGALLSEYPLGTPPDRKNFPPRNRIISGLSRGVLVVEAAAKSGALITARFAAEQGRDVFAVPGSILTKRHLGTNTLISDGATPVLTPEDVVRELQLGMLPQKQEARQVIEATENESQLLAWLSDEPLHIDEIGHLAGLPISEVSSMLTVLELKGLARQAGKMMYVNTRERGPEYRSRPRAETQ